MKSSIDIKKLKIMYRKVKSKDEFYRETGIGRSTISSIFNGCGCPNAKTITALAEYFEVPCGFFFTDYEKYHGKKIDEKDAGYKHKLVLSDAVILYNE